MSYSPLNAIAHPPFDAVASLRKHVILRDDFLAGTTATGLVGELGWTITSVAGAATRMSTLSALRPSSRVTLGSFP